MSESGCVHDNDKVIICIIYIIICIIIFFNLLQYDKVQQLVIQVI